MKKELPISFAVFRTLVALIAALPLTFFILALSGAGPAAELLEQPLAAIKYWLYSQTGVDIQ